MFRSRSRGFYLYVFLRSCIKEREREITSLSDTYTVSSNTALAWGIALQEKASCSAISLSLFRYDSNLLDWILDGCIRTGESYIVSLSLSLSKSKVWRMKTESRLWFASLEASEICMATNPGKRSSPYVRRSSCFSFLHAFTVHNLASSAYVSIFPYVTIILYVLLHTCRLERCVTFHCSSDMQTYDERVASLLADVLE